MDASTTVFKTEPERLQGRALKAYFILMRRAMGKQPSGCEGA